MVVVGLAVVVAVVVSVLNVRAPLLHSSTVVLVVATLIENHMVAWALAVALVGVVLLLVTMAHTLAATKLVVAAVVADEGLWIEFLTLVARSGCSS